MNNIHLSLCKILIINILFVRRCVKLRNVEKVRCWAAMVYAMLKHFRICKFTINGKETEIICVNVFIFLYLRKDLLNLTGQIRKT